VREITSELMRALMSLTGIAAKKAGMAKVWEAEGRLPKKKEWPDLEFAPEGHWKAIVDLGGCANFVIVANRALDDDGRFELDGFAEPMLDAELRPFGAGRS